MFVRLVAVLMCLALLGIGFFSIRSSVNGSPAFDLSARIDGVTGDWRVQYGPAHYHRALYLKQLGEGFLRGDVLVTEATGAEEEIASDEVALVRAKRAEELLLQSLNLLPSNAYTWASLAWANAMQDKSENAREAMQISWQLAPYNLALAYDRLGFTEFLAQGVLKRGAPDMNTAELTGVQRDFTTIYTYDPKMAATIAESSPLISDVRKDSD